MNTNDLLTLCERLYDNTHPLTGNDAGRESRLNDATVREHLGALISYLRPERADSSQRLTANEVTDLCEQLGDMAYSPTPEQLEKIFLGSRSIADPRLRGLPAYRRYRNVLSRPELRKQLREHADLISSGGSGTEKKKPASTKKPWREVDFFATSPFDKLSNEKATELYREVQALGLRKATDRLPAYMAKARINVPRAFEPWTREERALLIEAMCYTNDREKLAGIFGRSQKAVGEEGMRLIWQSQQKQEAA